MAVVVVESPAKAKTINKYLGSDYTVLASYGHVRDLPPKDGSVDPEHDFEMVWEIDPKSQKHVRAIADALKDDAALILATDPDREGEAISWHLLEALTKRRALKKDAKVQRVVFNAITKSAVSEAMKAPRDVDRQLVDAYLARRALDYLVGFTLSPVLWRKLPGAKSAGRVQSVALRLIVEREMEIEAFRAREYWSVKAELETPSGERYQARLVTLDGRKLDRFDIADAEAAAKAVAAIAEAADGLRVASVESKPATRNPYPPFMTSTLQQEASRKLGMGAREAMATAQRLYEAGHITYMRTDGLDMAPEAVQAARETIAKRYGDRYVPGRPRVYKTKAKNAQEAHECIRPTDMGKAPADLSLDRDQKRLYELIWKRAIASQMEAARLERTTVEIEGGKVGLRATGQIVKFDGFLRVYEEGRDEPEDEEGARLPEIAEGEPAKIAPLRGSGLGEEASKLAAEKPDAFQTLSGGEAAAGKDLAVLALQHFTQPPPRYTEATLVKRMEELGIGRPSTYASIVDTIQTRGYVRKEKNRLQPEDKGRLVTAFLENYFKRYVEYDFTASLEEGLDDVSGGRRDWKALLRDFWRDFKGHVDETKELRISEVLETINEVLSPHIFPDRGDGSDPRSCPLCGEGRLSIRTGKFGAFVGCSNYPNCKFTRPLAGDQEGPAEAAGEGKLLGHDPEGAPVTLRTGRFGPYVQLGEQAEGGPKPKRSSIPKGVSPEDVTLDMALGLLALPREIGRHPEDGEPVECGIGRFGPYVKHGKTYASVPKDEDVLTLGMNRAVDLLAQKRAGGGRGRAGPKALRELGEHPEGGGVTLHEGRYGPYVKWGKVNATLPKEMKPDAVTLDEALALIADKAPKKKAAKPKKAAGAASGGAKTAAKKAAGKSKTAAAKPRRASAAKGDGGKAKKTAET